MVDKGLRLHLGRRDGVRVRISRVWLYLLMTALAAVMTLPLIYAVGTAFKPLDELLRFPPIFFVRRPTMDNFSDLDRPRCRFCAICSTACSSPPQPRPERSSCPRWAAMR